MLYSLHSDKVIERPEKDEIISFKDYSFTYLGSEFPVLRNINLTIRKGELVIIAGSSGCGKSTLLRSVNGLIPHMYSGETKGSVHVNGVDVSRVQVVDLAKKVGFVFQNPENQIFMFSVERDVAFGLENLGLPRDVIRERVDWSLRLLSIEHLAQRAPHELSDGQKQRVALAGVLAMKPDVLILDEPTSLLDPSTAKELIEVVKMLNSELGVTVIIVEHRLDLIVSDATRVICMSKGEVKLDGSARNVLSDQFISLFGVSTPLPARLNLLLRNEGISLGKLPLTITELVEQINVKFR